MYNKSVKIISFKKGVGLIEVIIGSSIIALTISVLLFVYVLVSRFAMNNISTLKAVQLGEETVEVLKFLRSLSWQNQISPLAIGTTYHPYFDTNYSPSRWTATTSNILLEDFYTVSFVLSSVYRDQSHNIVSSGGSLDSNSRKVNVSVSWRQEGATTTKSFESYLFNIFNN